MTDYTALIAALREEGATVAILAVEWNIPALTAKRILEAADAIEQLVKERDAAVRDLKLAMQRDFSECVICKNYGDYPRKGKCRECFQGAENNFEWRGIHD